MAGKNGSVIIGIDGDDSGLQKELADVKRSARSAAATIAAEYRKAGMNQSDAMKKAWADVKKAQSEGLKVTVNGVETITRENEKIISQKDDLGDVYDELGDSAKDAAKDVEDASRKSRLLTKDTLKGIGGALGNTVAVVAKMGAAVYAAGTAIGAVGVKYNAEIEQLQTSFEVMTGSAEKAADVVNRLRRMGAETPFEMTDLTRITQLLMQYGFTADDALEKMRMLGDISQGNAEAMNSIALGYAQMSSAGKVNLQDIKQMINICHTA